MHPSEKQIRFAQDIAKELNLTLSKNITSEKSACAEFIKSHKEKFYNSLKTGNPCNAPKADSSNGSNETLQSKKGTKKDPTSNIANKSEATEILQYWHEGLIRTAFEGYGSLESELTGVQSFTLDKIDYVLNNFQCKNLPNIDDKNTQEGTVLHLIMILESVNGSQSDHSNNIVLLIFPLTICFEDTNTPSQKLPYEWQRAGKEIPLFNQRLLGEEAEIEGLMLHNDNALENLLIGAEVNLSANASLHQCLDFLDQCFNALTETENGCAGWINTFVINQKNYARLRNKQVRFKLVDGSAVSGATRNIRLCYEELIGGGECINGSRLELFRQLTGGAQASSHAHPKPFSIQNEKQSWDKLSHYLGHMDNMATHQERSCYPLDPAQRIALTLFRKVNNGNLLAVNGPPGTGKTSLLRAVIADEWIRPLISDNKLPECPIIIATAATNQAVTNIISSFDSVPGPSLFNTEGERTTEPVSIESRWLPHLISYGWYQPASIGTKAAEYQNFQVITRRSPKQPWSFDFATKDFGAAEKNFPYIEHCYLTVACEFFNQKDTISAVAEKFRTKIQDTVRDMDEISVLLTNWKSSLDLLIHSAWNFKEEKVFYDVLKQHLEMQTPTGDIALVNHQIENIKTKLSLLKKAANELKKKNHLSLFFRFIHFIKQLIRPKQSEDQCNILTKSLGELGIEFPSDKDSITTALNAIQSKRDELEKQLIDLTIDKDRLEMHIKRNDQLLTKLKKARENYLSLLDQMHMTGKKLSLQIECLEGNGAKQLIKTIEYTYQLVLKGQDFNLDTVYQSFLDSIQNWLDTNIRPKLFHLSARYWEARYLMYKKPLYQNKDYTPSSGERIRELAMLAPVFVTTSYSAPKLMQCADENRVFNYLYGYADLLIVDEAGQGTSEIGACTFAFAKRAIVVGDTQQLKPVWNITNTIDKLIHKKMNLAQNLDDMKEKGLLMSTGSIMLMAQFATAFYDEHKDERGVMLTNHYRCRSPIIEICNEMVYCGALSVVTAATEPKKEWRSPLGFLVVPGDSTKLNSGSRCNVKETEWIARWLKENESSILTHYNTDKEQGLAELVAIITPFKGQVSYIKKEIAKAFGENLKDKNALANQMVIGTVHSLQGSERAIVIFSMVDSAVPTENHFYDTDTSLINVAISRAKEVFIIALDQQSVNYGRSLTRQRLNKPSDYLFYHIVQHGKRLNSRRLLLIESPNKRAHLEEALGQGMELEIIATNGHLTQLDSSSDWDPLTAEEPKWLPLSDKEALIYERTSLLWPDLEAIYIATDPDAEGECIAWQFINRVKSFLPPANQNKIQPDIKRMRFYNLVTKDIKEAYINTSAGLDAGLVKSALFRAILDQTLSRHYPQKLGVGSKNSFHAGIGRVQLAILDIAQQITNQKEQYYIEVALAVPELNELGKFILCQTDNSEPILFTDPLKAKNAAETLAVIVSNKTEIQLEWNAVLEQLPEYPAINTASFLALASKTYDLTPQEIMDILQALYEGQKLTYKEPVLEQQA